jgi:hypothetical protein
LNWESLPQLGWTVLVEDFCKSGSKIIKIWQKNSFEAPKMQFFFTKSLIFTRLRIQQQISRAGYGTLPWGGWRL